MYRTYCKFCCLSTNNKQQKQKLFNKKQKSKQKQKQKTILFNKQKKLK